MGGTVVGCVAEERAVPRRRQNKQTKKSEPEQLFKYWIEIRQLNDNTIRKLPLTAAIMVPLVDHLCRADGFCASRTTPGP